MLILNLDIKLPFEGGGFFCDYIGIGAKSYQIILLKRDQFISFSSIFGNIFIRLVIMEKRKI